MFGAILIYHAVEPSGPFISFNNTRLYTKCLELGTNLLLRLCEYVLHTIRS